MNRGNDILIKTTAHVKKKKGKKKNSIVDRGVSFIRNIFSRNPVHCSGGDEWMLVCT